MNDVILNDKYPMKDREFCYSLDPSTFNQVWKEQVPDKFTIKLVDKHVLERDINKKPKLELNEKWAVLLNTISSLERFLNQGFGYIAMTAEKKIVASCRTDYILDNHCEFAIETHDQYRRIGLATCVAYTTLEYAKSKNITNVGWHCWEDNIPSQKTAEKIGFKKKSISRVLFAFYDEIFIRKFKEEWDKTHEH